jgi:hypothetical protein
LGLFPEECSFITTMGQQRALIVGLTYLNETHYFKGPVNNAIRVKDMLINYYDFAPDDVKLVVDANGTMNTPQLNEFRVKETKTMINDEYICRKLSKMIKKKKIYSRRHNIVLVFGTWRMF